MAVSIRTAIARLEDALRELDVTREAQAYGLALNSLAVVKDRIQNRQIDADGVDLGTYSQAKVPYWYYYGKSTVGGNANKVKALYEKYGYWASYMDWRETNIGPNRRIDLFFTGAMFRSMFPVVVRRTAEMITLTFRCNRAEQQEYFEYHQERWPRAFALSQAELKDLEELNRLRAKKLIDKIFN